MQGMTRSLPGVVLHHSQLIETECPMQERDVLVPVSGGGRSPEEFLSVLLGHSEHSCHVLQKQFDVRSAFEVDHARGFGNVQAEQPTVDQNQSIGGSALETSDLSVLRVTL